MCLAIGSNPARKCCRDLMSKYRLAVGSIPAWRNTPRSKGSIRSELIKISAALS